MKIITYTNKALTLNFTHLLRQSLLRYAVTIALFLLPERKAIASNAPKKLPLKEHTTTPVTASKPKYQPIKKDAVIIEIDERKRKNWGSIGISIADATIAQPFIGYRSIGKWVYGIAGLGVQLITNTTFLLWEVINRSLSVHIGAGFFLDKQKDLNAELLIHYLMPFGLPKGTKRAGQFLPQVRLLRHIDLSNNISFRIGGCLGIPIKPHNGSSVLFKNEKLIPGLFINFSYHI